MAARTDILEYRESLRIPLAGSVLFHALLFGSLLGYAWWENRGREPFGSPNPGGGATTITPVSQINLPSVGGIVNPVANDTESRVPLPPKETKAKEKAPPDDSDAIALKTKRQRKHPSEIAASAQQYRPKDANRPNQVYSSAGQAASTPMFGSTSGGGIGIGQGGSMGTRFGWYEQMLREKVGSKWRVSDVDPRLQTAPPVIVIFEVLRDGSVRNIRLLQRSGNYELDMSAQRAITEASPFQPLPPGYERNSASIEFWFQLKR